MNHLKIVKQINAEMADPDFPSRRARPPRKPVAEKKSSATPSSHLAPDASVNVAEQLADFHAKKAKRIAAEAARAERARQLEAARSQLAEAYAAIERHRAAIEKSLLDVRPAQLELLSKFRWFLLKEHRDDVDLIIDSLWQDVDEMRKEGRSELFVRRVLRKHVFFTIVRYTWEGMTSIFKRLSPMSWLFKMFGKG